MEGDQDTEKDTVKERGRDRETETVRRGKTVRQNKKRATLCDCVMTWL